MSEPTVKLSLKSLNERVTTLEDWVQAPIIAPATEVPVGPDPEYFNDILVATINALYVTRSQGAYNIAKALEQKYFDGVNQKVAGDELLKSGSLSSAAKEG